MLNPAHDFDGIYRHQSGHLARCLSVAHGPHETGQWILIGNGPLGYDGNAVFLPFAEFSSQRLDVRKEDVPRVMNPLVTGKAFETKNGSQVYCIAKHTDGEFEMTVLKGGHGMLNQDLRGHGVGSSYMVRGDGTPRKMTGAVNNGLDGMTVVKAGKPFRITDPLAMALAHGIADIAARRGF